MLFLVDNDNKISGVIEDPNAFPGWTTTPIPGESRDPNDYYWDGTEAIAKPPKPEGNYYWDEEDHRWESIAPSQPQLPPPVENWAGLIDYFRNTTPWQRMYQASTLTLEANTAFNFLLTTVTAIHSAADFVGAIALIRAAMRNIESLGDFSPEELEFIQDVFTDCGFDPGEFDLLPYQE